MARQSVQAINFGEHAAAIVPHMWRAMWLSCIEPLEEDCDKRTFEYAICKASDTAIVRFT